MKTKLITPIASAFVLLLAVSCEKDDPVTAINEPPAPEECTFCLGEVLELGTDSLIAATSYAQQVDFYNYAQNAGTNPVSETPTGFYGFQGGVSIAFNAAGLPMVCNPNRVTFVHARVTSNTNDIPALVNVQFPGTPVISTIPDSLQYYLTPYGYTVENYFGPGVVPQGMSGGFWTGVVDSIIISGPEFASATVGADLFESELRSICVSHQ